MSTGAPLAAATAAATATLSDRRVLLGLTLLVVVLYFPFAGNYGMWDPWETHYSEVARQMLMRHDYVSLWWPGSPLDRNEFWSKPVLTFWLIALGMGVAGLERAGGPALPGSGIPGTSDSELAIGWAAEWAARIPFLLCALACLWAVFELVRRLAGRRPAIWSVVILATSSQFAFVARQAMTDMAFVAPMAVALCYAGLGLLLPAEEVEAELERRSRRIGRLTLSWPHAPVYYGLLVLIALFVVPQLVIISIQLQAVVPLGGYVLRMVGLVPMLPWIGALVAYLWAGSRARCKRQLYFHIAFLMCGLATLAKGPAGLALPVLAVLGYLLMEGELGRLLPAAPDTEGAPRRSLRGLGALAWRFISRNPLELGLGLVLFIAVTFPWYHAMLTRHGMGFWNEFIGDNYVRRAAGRHGDRGTFEYYILQIGLGMFPWIGVVAPGFFLAFGKLGRDLGSRLRGFALAWFLVMFGVMSLVNTKFHHYILPALPALAILAGLELDELMRRPTVRGALGVLLVGLPLTALAGRDLALFPARLSWLFDYDYVNAPGGGRPWPTAPEYDYKIRIGVFVAVACAATVLLGLVTLLRARRGAEVSEEAGAPAADVALDLPRWAWLGLLLVPPACFIVAEGWQPPFLAGPHPLANGWILVGAAAALVLFGMLSAGLRAAATRWATVALGALGIFGCVWTAWILDRYLTDLSPHWSQKHVIASYYQHRSGPDEPLIAWQMYWRGETFYTKNAIYDHRLRAEDKTVFLNDRNVEKLQTYLRTHAGRRVFFVVERSRFESLRALLPEKARPTLKPVDETNNKLYLATAQL